MSKTTIELSKRTRDRLQEERLPSETSYEDTVKRLLGDSEGQAWTREEIKTIASDVFQENARRVSR